MGVQAKPAIWTLRRKIVPNVLPLLVGIPFWVCAAILGRHGSFLDAIELATFGLLICAVSLNWLGVTGNEGMRADLARRVIPPADAIFIGFSRPGFVNALDPHEDIGFFWLESDRLVIRGERLNMEMPRDRSMMIGFAPNPHTLLGLGRWVTLGTENELKVRVEPRERGSLRANKMLGVEWKSRIEKWSRLLS